MSTNRLPDLALVAVTPDDPDVRSSLPERLQTLCRAGVTAVMFREKSLDDAAFAALGRRCRDAVRSAGGVFILNERLGLVDDVAPDLVHLTHRSGALDEIRPSDAGSLPRGVSIHGVDEALAWCDLVDYLVFGPVFATPSKVGWTPAGLLPLRELCERASRPVVAIGGMGPEEAERAVVAGAVGVAAIRALFGPTGAQIATAMIAAVRSARRRRGGAPADEKRSVANGGRSVPFDSEWPTDRRTR